MYKLKRILSFIIAVVFVISMVPISGLVETVHADSDMSILFQRIQNTSGGEKLQYVISYKGNPLNKPYIEIEGADGTNYAIDTTKYKESDLVSGSLITIDRDYLTNVYGQGYAPVFYDGLKTIKVTNNKPDGTQETVTKKFIAVSPPKILSTNVVNKTLFVNDYLSIHGSNFDSVNTVLVDGVSYAVAPYGDEIDVMIDRAGTGTGDITMYKTTGDGTSSTAYPNAIQLIYQKSAYVVSRLSGINIEMVQPNTGSVNGGTYVKLRNKAGLTGLNDQVKVYFARIVNGVMEPLSTANLATGNSFDPATNTLTVRTKASTSGAGDARIVITSPDGTSRYDDSANPLLYTFVEASNALTLNTVNPSSAKASSGAKVTLIGKNIGTLNITGLSYPAGKDFASSVTNVENQVNGDVTTTYVTLNGLKYSINNEEHTVNVVKKINVVVGGSAKTVVDAVYSGSDVHGVFSPESSFSVQQDQLYVQLPIVNLGTKEFETYDTVVSTETFIYDAEHPTVQLIPSKIEEYTLSNSFTYNSDFVLPTVSSITPGYGPKDQKITVRIKGSNFYVLQQTTQRLKPIVKIGTTVNDANAKVLENVRVINSTTGVEVDGSPSNYKGDMIVGDIPASPDGNIVMAANIYVYNPDAYNAADPEHIVYFGQPGILNAAFKFMNPDPVQYPHIIDVTPNLVSSAGGEEVVITGSNFKTNSELYVDGQKITPITISGTGEKITFKTPKGSPGVVSLQVLNPDSGGMASSTLEYTSIYTSPAITKITPNKGGAYTLATITGKNFLSADVTAKPEEVYKLIGARVKFNNKDLNSYSLDSSGSIILKNYNYKAGTVKPVFKNDASFDMDYRDVVFVDEAHDGVFLPKEEQGTMYLRDGNGNRYKAFVDSEDGNKVKLVNQNDVTSDAITYDYSGSAVKMTFTINGTTYTLETKTPYLIQTQSGISTIVGNMVRVIDDTTLEVTIPPLKPSQGNNDVTVVNPDTAFATLKDGFFYFSSMGSNPKIDTLYPKEGTIYGGTIIKITGSDFREGVEVYFGSEKATSVTLSADQKTIYAILPAYPKVLPKGVDSVQVPVVIINPKDGGTAVWGERFTYRIPTSYPAITKIDPNKWNASGGIDVTISGENFMQGEPYIDENGNNQYDEGEPYIDLNNNGTRESSCIQDTYDPDTGQTIRTIIQELAPKVYFGGELATVKDVLYNRLIVILPKYNGSGAVDVVVVNPDTGTAVKKGGFTYSSSAPKITSVVPAVGPKSGGTQVTIKGSDFILDAIKVFIGTADDMGTQLISARSLVKPITLANLTVDYDDLNPPSAEGNTALTMTYTVKADDGQIKDITVTKYIDIANEKTDYQVTFAPEDFIAEGADADALLKLMAGEETVNMKIVDSQMQVMRRLAKVDTVNSSDTELIIYTPPSSTIGMKDIQVINNDGGTAKSSFQYGNPVSIPRIDEIKPNRRVDYTLGGNPQSKYLVEVSTKGGEQIRIVGKEFRDGIKVMIGDQQAEVISKTDMSDGSSELLVKVPVPTAANKNVELKVTVINTDMASAVSTVYPAEATKPADWYPYWFVYRDSNTNPVITKVTPNKGPRSGGTVITIEGDDFREGAKVFIGGLECTDVEIVSYKKITAVTAPMGSPITKPGSYAVEVKNYESGVVSGTAVLDNAFTYISSPAIVGIYEVGSMDANGNYAVGSPVSNLKITGGETVMLEVTDLLDGPTVVIGGTIEKITDYGNIPQGIRGMNAAGEDVVVTGGTSVTVVKVQDKLYVIIKTPVGTTDDNNTIIIINSDTGVSEPYKAPYIKPVPDRPVGLKAEVVDGDTIKLEWTPSESALYYEIYVSVSADGRGTKVFQYLLSIAADPSAETVQRYYVEGLKPSTYYSFQMKSFNEYGGSTVSPATAYRKTLEDINSTYYQTSNNGQIGLPQNDTVKMTGTGVNYIAGEKSVGNSVTGLNVGFEQAAYYTANPKAVDISFGLIKKYPNNQIRISDRNINLQMTVNSLAVDAMIPVEAEKAADAVMRVTINRALGSREDAVRTSVPKGYKAVISPVGIDLSMQIQSDVTRIDSFKTPVDLTVQYDDALKKMYQGGIYVGYYDPATKKLQILGTAGNSGTVAVQILKSGEYVLVGKISK